MYVQVARHLCTSPSLRGEQVVLLVRADEGLRIGNLFLVRIAMSTHGVAISPLRAVLCVSSPRRFVLLRLPRLLCEVSTSRQEVRLVILVRLPRLL